MDRFIHRENIAIFKRRLADPKTTEANRKLLRGLLAKEEALLAQAEARLKLTEPNRRAPAHSA